MFEGIYADYNYNGRSRVSDVGGRKVLGTGGSLNRYIHTGNAYGRHRFGRDMYVSKMQKKEFFEKIAKIGIVIATAIGGYKIVNKFAKPKNKSMVDKMVDKFKSSNKTNKKGFFAKIFKKK